MNSSEVMHMVTSFIVPPGKTVTLNDYDPDYTGKYRHKKEVASLTEKLTGEMFDLQHKLYAENKQSLLIVLQAMDAGGKDGTTKHVMGGLNPQGCRVTSFKVPSDEELSHDFLWRVHKQVPPNGTIGIFNRSHYEDVLVVRVEHLVPKKAWMERYEQINNFEKILVQNKITILKFFLHISKGEQKKRFEDRLQIPHKNWKFSIADIEKRKYWDQYMRAYEDVFNKCSKPYAPWYIIPANRKWYRNFIIAKIITHTLRKMNPSYPEPKEDLSGIKII